MKLTVAPSNRAILLSREDIRGREWQIDLEVDALTHEQREQIALRLYDDKYVCEGIILGERGMIPFIIDEDQPVLLRVDSTDLADLIEALERDTRWQL